MSSKLIQPKLRNSSNQLTAKQRVFVSAYFSDNEMNATKAAEVAGYGCPGAAGGKLLSNKTIQRAIGVELRKRLQNSEITAARVLKELGHIGFLDPQDMFNDDDSLKQIKSMPEHIRRCIAGIEVKQVKVKRAKDEKGEDILLESSIVKIKLWPKTDALQLIAKHLGMLDERFKVTHGIDPAAQAVLKSLLEKLENQPTQVIDANYIEHAAGSLPDMSASNDSDSEIGEIIDGKVVKPDNDK
jgi:phage terminase small subunit